MKRSEYEKFEAFKQRNRGQRKRVHELAKELNIPVKDLLTKAKELGIVLKSHSSTLTEKQIQALKNGSFQQENEPQTGKIILVKKQNFNKKLFLRALENNDLEVINTMPVSAIQAYYLKLVKGNWKIIKDMPEEFKTEELCLAALTINRKAIKYIPDNLKSEKIQKFVTCKASHSTSYLSLENERNDIKSEIIDLLEKVSHDKHLNELIPISNSQDKVFNFRLIKAGFLAKYPEFSDKISNITKSSNYLRFATGTKGMYYAWIFRNGDLEIILEFDNKDKELYKYFLSIESELQNFFKEKLIIGQSKIKTFVYISKAKYSLNWAVETMFGFIKIIGDKLNNFQQNNSTTIISKETAITSNTLNVNILVNEEVIEGQKVSIKTTRYERNSKNRALALSIHGTTCLTCGFNFNEFYGKDLAKDFIEVHHIIPVSKGKTKVNPKTDLVPLCSNCHSMIHKEMNKISSIEEIIERYKKQ